MKRATLMFDEEFIILLYEKYESMISEVRLFGVDQMIRRGSRFTMLPNSIIQVFQIPSVCPDVEER